MNTLDVVWNTDLVTLCDLLEPQSVDCIICDPPYGQTACAWDEVIPFEPMWAGFKRVIKPRGAIVMTASQPFTSRLVCSNLGMFRYEWVWNKVNMFTNQMNAAIRPMRQHEDVIVFSVESHNYYPQFRKGKPYTTKRAGNIQVYAISRRNGVNETGEMYPGTVIDVPARNPLEQGYHPTQKPVALFEYLIRTYTQPGDVVLDPTCGSGTTAIAARNTGRHFICGDLELKYVQIARDRLRLPFEKSQLPVKNDLSGLPLFDREQSA